MSSRHPDPLARPHDPDRVHYANGMLLDEQDFRDEQTYLRARLARALGYLHGHGTVAGLDVRTPREDEDIADEHVIVVTRGLAIDRLGRLIELPLGYCIRAREWLRAEVERDPDAVGQSFANSDEGDGVQAVVADLFLGFDVCPRGATPAFGIGNNDATDAFTAHRLRDGTHLRLVLRTEADKGPVTQRPPLPELFDVDPESPATFEDALAQVLEKKLLSGWKEAERWDEDDADKALQPGDEYAPTQEQTEVLLARVRLPAAVAGANEPPTYDDQGVIEIDNAVRVLSYTTYELCWLLRASWRERP
jgi:hypothetical protein